MDVLLLKSNRFQDLVQNFEQWLRVIGYAEKSVLGMPSCIIEMLLYFENTGCFRFSDIDNPKIIEYYAHLKKRANKSKGGILSNSTLNKHLQSIYNFIKYLDQSEILKLPKLEIPLEHKEEHSIAILSEDEITELFKVSFQANPDPTSSLLSARDRAMLSVFYSCGLRRNEGFLLNVSDINFKRRILFVRNGKNYSQRMVPFNRTNAFYMENYLLETRPKLLDKAKQNAFFITQRARRMKGQSLLLRLKILADRTQNQEIIEKQIGLHTLRHSIATHLLSRGMKLHIISAFLGHSSIEATQIYTHLIEEENGSF